MELWGTVVATGVVDFWLLIVVDAAADVDFWVGAEGVVCVTVVAGCVGTCCPGMGEVLTSGSVLLVAGEVAACGSNDAANGDTDDSAVKDKQVAPNSTTTSRSTSKQQS